MPTLHLLGTGASLSGPGRTTTMLALQGERSDLLIDCGGDAIERMLSAGLEIDHLSALILTHEHPDHVCGFPLLVQKLWLAKRRRPLPIHGPARALEQARRLFASFDTSGWEAMPPLAWQPVEPKEGTGLWKDEEWSISASPGSHGRTPVIGLRAVAAASGGVVAYSSDTEPCSAIGRIARSAALLVHEATGDFRGHSTAAGAAAIAAEAGAERLVLVHLPPEPAEQEVRAGREIFPALQLGRDGDAFPL